MDQAAARKIASAKTDWPVRLGAYSDSVFVFSPTEEVMDAIYWIVDRKTGSARQGTFLRDLMPIYETLTIPDEETPKEG